MFCYAPVRMPRKPAKFNKDEYCTPAEELALVYAVIGIPDVDPCSNERSLVVSKRAYCKGDESAFIAETKARTMFMNCPYSNTAWWVAKLLEWWKCGHEREVVMLLSAETGLVWWQEELLPSIDRWIFLPRIAFLADGVPMKGNRCNSALIYKGHRKRLVGQIWPKPVFRPCR